MPLSGVLVASPGTGAISSPSNMVTTPSRPGLGSIAMGWLSLVPSTLQQVPVGLGHPTDKTLLEYSTHSQLIREQVLGDAGSSSSQEMERIRSSLRLSAGSGSGQRGQLEMGDVLPAWHFIFTLGKGVGEPREPALCPHSLKWGQGLAEISTQLQPCPTGQLGETWHCVLPLRQAQTHPGPGTGHPYPWPWGQGESGGKGL